jgi:hypothetical protein
MAQGGSAYRDLGDYPANPFIQQRQTFAQSQANQAKTQAAASGGAGMFNTGEAGSGGGGWWTPTMPNTSNIKSGQEWATKNLSKNFMGGMGQMYESYQQPPKSLAEMYQGMMAGNPELEDIERNRALALVKGQAGTAQQMMMRGLAPGGMDSGAYMGGMADILRNMQSGIGDVGIQAYMKNLADRETRQKQMIDYSQADIGNKLGWQQGYGGWMQQMLPYEQWTVQYPEQLRQQRASAALNRQMAIEQINAQRRGEAMGWLGQLGNLGQNAVENQYTGQNAWQGYQGQQAGAYGQVYNPQWNPYQ